MKEFVDTNVFAYAFDKDQPKHRRVARQVLRRLARDGCGVISTQVMLELYSVLTRKMDMSAPRAGKVVCGLARLEVVGMQAGLVVEALELSAVHAVSVWDAAVLVAAWAAKCAQILTQDLQHGQMLAGVRVVNPFLNLV